MVVDLDIYIYVYMHAVTLMDSFFFFCYTLQIVIHTWIFLYS